MKANTLLRSLLLFAGAALAVPKPLQIWVSSQADLKYYEKMIGVYKQKIDTGFHAEVKAFGFMEMPDKLAIAIKSGINPPDIVQFDEIFFSLYLKGNIPFVDLTDRLAKSPLGTGILKQRMGLFTWKDRIYGVPQSVSSVVLWYRDDIFKELGIMPKDLETWDKFDAVGMKVKTATRGMIALDWSYVGILLRQRGYDFYGADGKPFPDSAIIAQTWQRVADWSKNGIGLLPDRSSIFEPEFFNSYVANNGVLSVMGPDWYGLDMIQNFDQAHKGKWRAMALPTWTDSLSHGNKKTSSFSGQGLVIFKKSRKVENCWKFVEWVNSDIDANVDRFIGGNCFPPYQPAWSDMRLSQPFAYFGNQNLGQLFAELAPTAPFTAQSPLNAVIVNFMREQYFGAVIHNSSTPEQALGGIKEQINLMMGGKKKKP